MTSNLENRVYNINKCIREPNYKYNEAVTGSLVSSKVADLLPEVRAEVAVEPVGDPVVVVVPHRGPQ